MNIAVLGIGVEGRAVLKFLKKSRDYQGAKIALLDKKLDPHYLDNLKYFDFIIKSPGVSFNLPKVRAAWRTGVPFSSSTDLFFKTAEKKQVMVIGVTGTKGKGTTSTLIYRILKAGGKRVHLAGNIGTPAIELLPKIKKGEIVVLELSSFQLQNLRHSPSIAVVLDIFPDHLDSHKNFKEYLTAKANIAGWQKPSDKIFYLSSNKHSSDIARKSHGQKFPVDPYIPNSLLRFNSYGKQAYELGSKDVLEKILKIPGNHNIKNAAMASALGLYFKIKPEVIKRVLENFEGLEHRLEFVRKITVRQAHHRNKSTIYFYNDSGSTNPETSAAAVRAFPGPKILIAGGANKNLNYAPLKKALKNSNTTAVILFGQNKFKIAKQIRNEQPHNVASQSRSQRETNKTTGAKKKTEIKIVSNNLEAAVKAALTEAVHICRILHIACHILFSPGSTSFDMFQNYKDRGEQFKKIVKTL